MADRLEDLKSLSEDFHMLSKPIAEMATELPKAKSRIMEVEALLHRETQERETSKNELRTLQLQYNSVCEEQRSIHPRATKAENALQKAEKDIAELRIRDDELRSLLATYEKRIRLESENRERRESELAQISIELAESVERWKALSAEKELEQTRFDEALRDGRRLQKIIDHQVQQIVEYQSKISDCENTVRANAHTADALQARLDIERSDHQAAMHAQGLIGSALAAENASLVLKVDELTARLDAADHSARQLRTIIMERTDALQASDEMLRTKVRELSLSERQNFVLEQHLHDQSAQLTESKRATNEATVNGAMLQKALTAKSASLDVAIQQSKSRADQIEELSSRFEVDRAAYEAENRRHLEEIESERAERTLAQGALKIARESRSSLQRQNESLKRANRAIRNGSSDDGHDSVSELQCPSKDSMPDSSIQNTTMSNVSHFSPKPKETVESSLEKY
jgi:crescentin